MDRDELTLHSLRDSSLAIPSADDSVPAGLPAATGDQSQTGQSVNTQALQVGATARPDEGTVTLPMTAAVRAAVERSGVTAYELVGPVAFLLAPLLFGAFALPSLLTLVPRVLRGIPPYSAQVPQPVGAYLVDLVTMVFNLVPFVFGLYVGVYGLLHLFRLYRFRERGRRRDLEDGVFLRTSGPAAFSKRHRRSGDQYSISVASARLELEPIAGVSAWLRKATDDRQGWFSGWGFGGQTAGQLHCRVVADYTRQSRIALEVRQEGGSVLYRHPRYLSDE